MVSKYVGAVYLTNSLSSWEMELWHKLTSSSLKMVNLNKVFILCLKFINFQGKGSPDLWLNFLRCCLLCVRACREAVTLTFLMLHAVCLHQRDPMPWSVWGGLWEPLFVAECLFCISLPILRAWVFPGRWRQDVGWVVIKNLSCLPGVSSYLWFLYLLLVEIICLSPTSVVERN